MPVGVFFFFAVHRAGVGWASGEYALVEVDIELQ
jgi:hypothetical protein